MGCQVPGSVPLGQPHTGHCLAMRSRFVYQASDRLKATALSMGQVARQETLPAQYFSSRHILHAHSRHSLKSAYSAGGYHATVYKRIRIQLAATRMSDL